MKRAAVIIGVNKAKGLPTLLKAADSAVRMVEWASSQEIDFELITDAHGPVTPTQIRNAVKAYVDDRTCEQLIIYFAGHGVNIRFNEYWLLSDAPEDTQAAVNVTGSATLARYAGIPHVVFISDACRTAAETVQAQFVSGSEVFPNIGNGGLEKMVDQFYACTLGRPAYEARDAGTAASDFSAVYTTSLLRALMGEEIDAIDWPVGEEEVGYVRPRQLKKVLNSTVPDGLAKLGLPLSLFQVPDARISSDEQAWLSRFIYVGEQATHRARRGRDVRLSPPIGRVSATTLQSVVGALFHTALRDRPAFSAALAQAHQAGRKEINRMLDEVEYLAPGFGPDDIDTGCAIKVRGTSVVAARAGAGAPEQPQLISPDLVQFAAASANAGILLEFADGRGTILPCLPHYLACLSFDDDGDLVDVGYEPARSSARGAAFAPHAEGLRLLRALAAAASHAGVFAIDPQDWDTLVRQLGAAGAIDPGLALYVAYGMEGGAQRERVRQLNNAMRADHRCSFLDLAILGATSEDLKTWGRSVTDPAVLSPFPLRVSGWALLPALQLALPAPLHGLGETLSNSPWTLFDPAGVEMLRHFMETGGLQ